MAVLTIDVLLLTLQIDISQAANSHGPRHRNSSPTNVFCIMLPKFGWEKQSAHLKSNVQTILIWWWCKRQASSSHHCYHTSYLKNLTVTSSRQQAFKKHISGRSWGTPFANEIRNSKLRQQLRKDASPHCVIELPPRTPSLSFPRSSESSNLPKW
jgi:hypothetical protein